MGIFNNWDYSTKEAETNAMRQTALVKKFLDGESENILFERDLMGETPDAITASAKPAKIEYHPKRKCNECINKARKEN